MRTTSYFISDIHLGALSNSDNHRLELKLCRWLDMIAPSAKAVYMLGDILDYWYEYRYVVPKGYTRLFGTLARMADNGTEIYWFAGNHDVWLCDYFPKELGIKVLDGNLITEISGKRFFLAHGDGIGNVKPGMRFLRALFRNPIAQALYSAVHPRWTTPFALGCSLSSRNSDKTKYANRDNAKDSYTLQQYRNFASGENPDKIDYYVFGHIHKVVEEKLNNGAELISLGDWINLFSYGEFDGHEFRIRFFNE